MAAMNRGLNLPQIQKIMNEFERESSMMDMKEEMMGETIDDVMEDEEEDEEAEGEKILSQVLEEIGIDVSQKVGYIRVPWKFSSLIVHRWAKHQQRWLQHPYLWPIRSKHLL